MIIRLKKKAAGAGTKRLVLRKARGAARKSTDGCSDNGNADGFKEKVDKPVFLCGEKRRSSPDV